MAHSPATVDRRLPIPGDHRGWRAAPSPDGRWTAEPAEVKPPHRSRGFIWSAVALLVFNIASAFLISPGGQQRVQVAFNPSLIVSLLLGFGPTLLIVGVFVLVDRRMAKNGGDGRTRTLQVDGIWQRAMQAEIVEEIRQQPDLEGSEFFGRSLTINPDQKFSFNSGAEPLSRDLDMIEAAIPRANQVAKVERERLHAFAAEAERQLHDRDENMEQEMNLWSRNRRWSTRRTRRLRECPREL